MPAWSASAAHDAVQRIDLADQMALAQPADRRIARHRADRGEALGDQRRVRAHARGRRRGLAAGMAATHYDHVEPGLFHVKHLFPDTEAAEDFA